MIDKATLKRWLRPINFSVRADPYGKHFRIPVLRGTGLSHRRGHEIWMFDALQRLFRIQRRFGMIDIGVNIGQTLLKAKSANLACPYIGFEPNPFCVLYANELIELNRFDQCIVLPVALSAQAGMIEFLADGPADAAGSIVQGLRSNATMPRKQFVPMLTFDQVAADLTLAAMPVVKIDVEGAEGDVIRGMRNHLQKCRPLVLCEVLHAHSSAHIAMLKTRNDALLSSLEDAGYRVYRLIKSTDQSKVASILSIEAFPDEVFRYPESFQQCDYLFIPEESVPAVEGEFTPALD